MERGYLALWTYQGIFKTPKVQLSVLLEVDVVKLIDMSNFQNSMQCLYVCWCVTTIGPGRIIAPELNVSAEQFELTGVVIIIKWVRENGISYNISTFPDVPIAFLGDTSVRVTIPYDVQFTVNVLAMLCGKITTTEKNLFYGKVQKVNFSCLYLPTI